MGEALYENLLSAWGPLARTQGLVVIPDGDLTDDGAGHIGFPATTVLSPASGTFFTINAGSFTLGTLDALVVDLPPTSTPGTAVNARVVAWSNALRLYDSRDILVLGARGLVTGLWQWKSGTGGGNKKVRIPIALQMPGAVFSPGGSWPQIAGLTVWELPSWQFDTAIIGQLFGTVPVPLNMAIVPNARILLDWSSVGTTNNVRWGIGWTPIADGESMNPAAIAYGAEQDIAVPATARLRKLTPFPSSGVFSVTLDPGDLIAINVYRNASHANDTSTAIADLHGAYLEIDVK